MTSVLDKDFETNEPVFDSFDDIVKDLPYTRMVDSDGYVISEKDDWPDDIYSDYNFE